MTKVNQATIDLIKKWEGLSLSAYQDGEGVWTIGYGTTAKAGVGIVPKAGMRITQAEADKYFQMAVDKFSDTLKPNITKPINDNEFGALVSLAYNIGPGAFLRSTVLRKFNQGDKQGACNAIAMWNQDNGKVVQGLINRRKDEQKLFLTPVTTLTTLTDSKHPVPKSTPSVLGSILAWFGTFFKNP